MKSKHSITIIQQKPFELFWNHIFLNDFFFFGWKIIITQAKENPYIVVRWRGVEKCTSAKKGIDLRPSLLTLFERATR